MTLDIHEIDDGIIQDMQELMEDNWPAMVESYLANASKYIQAIKEGLAEDDFQKVSSGAHPLKSSSLSVGVSGIGKIAESIEVSARNIIEQGGDGNSINELIPSLEEALSYADAKLQETI
ncbi:MAG: Hpt domain-containing protein [Alphaproteobacteria bacterium]|nr:Hpt domain-containing protein [Alphaproteobacteria bacterium]